MIDRSHPASLVTGLRRRARRALVHGLIVTLSLATGVPPLAVAQGLDARAERSVAKLHAFDRQLAALADDLPNGTWDADELGFDLAFEEPETIVAWVRERIAFEPYAGLLRGPDGTLLAGAGNAVDQAVLLARLLNDAGYRARLARAHLDEASARALLAEVGATDAAATPANDTAAAEAVRAFVRELGGSPAEVEALVDRSRGNVARMEDLSERAAGDLIDALAAAGVSLGTGTIDELVDAVRDYVWVEWAVAEGDPWSAAHPGVDEDASWTRALEAEATYERDVPDDLQHRFRFQAVIERRRGGELETVPVMRAWERPTANLVGVALTYASVPDGFMDDAAAGRTTEESAAATSFVLPTFGGSLAEGAQLFDARGNTVPPDAAASPAAGVFQSVGGALGDATDAIGGEEESVALTAHWLEYTMIEPGGEATTHRRMLIDRLGPERRAAGEAGGPLAPLSDAELYQELQTTHTFLVEPGRTPHAHVERTMIEGLRSTMGYLEATVVASAQDGAALPEPPDEGTGAARAAPLRLLFRAFDDAPAATSGEVTAFRPRPGLVVVSTSWDGRERSTDIVANPRTVLVRDGDGVPRLDAEATVRTGAWETAMERTFLGGGPEVVDTYAFFAAADTQGVASLVVPPGDVAALEALAVPEASRAAMARDLERGYAVVAAERVPDGTREVAWWRVHPATGETLGRGGDGRGQATTDYSALQGMVAGAVISVFWGGAGFAACVGTGGDAACCLADAGTGFAVGFTVGIALTIAGATAAVGIGVGFGIDFVSTNLGMADSFGLADVLPSWCDRQSLAPLDGALASSSCGVAGPWSTGLTVPLPASAVPTSVPLG